MTPPRIGSLFSGYGGLDLAVERVFGAETAWHCQYDPEDPHQFAAAILRHHWPAVPNLGDITAVDWDQVEPVDIITGGFPCTDVSLAGKRAGLNDRTRSGLWAHMARAIAVLRPRLVVIENVPGLLSAKADRGVEPGTADVDPATGRPLALRALGAVLGDLAGLGFDAEWASVRASEVGAAHQRNRVFVLAWPADTEGPQLEGGRQGRPRRGGAAAADPDDLGGHGDWACGAGRHEPADHDQPAAHAARLGWGEGGSESARLGGGSDLAVGGAPDWGPYAAAIARWERLLGRPAPRPTDAAGRLSPALTEWMQGLAEGWLTAVPAPPGMTASQHRNAQLKAAGNGVVPQQAEAALRLLHHRAQAA